MRATFPRLPGLAVLLGAVGLLLVVAEPMIAQLRAPAPVRTPPLKRPGVAQALAIIPGAGHLYTGESRRAGLVFGTVVGILLVGGTLSDDAVQCPGEEYSDEYCTSPTIDAITYVTAGGVLAWSVFDAGHAARRTNARRLRRPALLVQVRPVGPAAGYRVGLTVPTGGR